MACLYLFFYKCSSNGVQCQELHNTDDIAQRRAVGSVTLAVSTIDMFGTVISSKIEFR
jgi:hypothetical protein